MKPAVLATLASALLAVPASAGDIGLAGMSPDAIAAIVDVRSFPSSIGPRRQDDLRTFTDYGFTEITLNDGTVELEEPDHSWMFAVTVIVAGDDHAVLCILDRALGGPTYDAQGPEAFRLGQDGLLVATGEALAAPSCPARP